MPELEPSREAFQSLRESTQSLIRVSIRAHAVVTVADLDAALEALLRARFVDRPALVNRLLSGIGPLGSFAVRIDVAYIIGAITDTERTHLNLIRKTRNDLAHDPNATFDAENIKQWCAALPEYADVGATMVKLADAVFPTGSPESKFFRAVGFLADGFNRRRSLIERLRWTEEQK